MFSKFTNMVKRLTDDAFFDRELNKEIEEMFDKKKARFESSIEDEMTEIIDAFKTTKLPFDTFYYSERHHQFMLVSHVFEDHNQAQQFEQDLKGIFKSAQIEIVQDKEGRHFLHMNPRTIKEDEFEKCLSLYKGNLFRAPDYRFDNKCRAEVKLLLDSLKTTDVPMDTLYLNYESNVYYIASHVFHDLDKIEEFANHFRVQFSAYCVCILEDLPGRYFLHLNPSALRKEDYEGFYKIHQIKLFDEIDDSKLDEANFENSLEHAKFILSSLRYTSYPMDCVIYDKRTDGFSIVSHVFKSEEKAKRYLEAYRKSFSDNAAMLIKDVQDRYFVLICPTLMNKDKFDNFIKENAINIMD